MPASRRAFSTASSNGAAASLSLTKPTGTVAGDLLVIFHTCDTGTVNEMSASGGGTWNSLQSRDSATGARTRTWWRVAGASEPANYTVSQSSGADGVATLVAIQGADTSVTPTVADAGATASGTSINTPSTTPPGTDAYEVRWVAGTGSGQVGASWSYGGSSPALSQQTALSSRQYVTGRAADRQLTSGAATGTVTATVTVAQSLRTAVTVNVKSAATNLVASVGTAQEQDTAYSVTADLIQEGEVIGLATVQARAFPVTHAGGVPPPAPPPPERRVTQDPRMPFVTTEIGFAANPDASGFLVLDDPERGRLDVGKLSPGGGQFVGGAIFTDVSDFASNITTRRGATRVDGPLIRYEAGTADLDLRNEDRRFDPTNLDGPYTLGSGTVATGLQKVVCSTGVPRLHGATVTVKSHPSNGPAALQGYSAVTHYGPSVSVAAPTGVASGVVLVAIHAADTGTVTQLGTPTGGAAWSLLGSVTHGAGSGHMRIWWKVAGASEPASYGFTKDSNADSSIAILAVAGADTATPKIGLVSAQNGAVVDTPSTVPAGADDFDIRIGAGYASSGAAMSWSPPAGYTNTVNINSRGYASIGVSYLALRNVGQGQSQILPMRPIRFFAAWGSQTNQVTNPTFEKDLSNWFAGDATSIARTTAQAFFGTYAIKLTKTGTNLFNLVAATTKWSSGVTIANDLVTISFYIYIPSATYDGVTNIVLVGNDSAGNAVFNTGVLGKPLGADRWHRFVKTVTTSGELFELQIQIWTDGVAPVGTDIAYIDAVQVVKGAVAEPFTENFQRYPLWRGFVDEFEVAWDEGNGPLWSQVGATATDAFKVFEAVDREASNPVGAGESTGARINRILNTVGWPVEDRSIAAGNSTLQETTLEGTPLSEMMQAVDSEIGELYMDETGKVVFRNRNAIFTETRSTTPQAIFGDDYTNPQELPWESLGISTDEAQLVNYVRVARVGGEPKVAQDLESQTRFLMRTFSREDLLLTDDAIVQSYANFILALSKEHELRFNTLVINPLKDPWRLFPQVLSRQIGDRIRIIRRPPGGGMPIVRDVFIRGIQHEIGQVFWRTTWQLQSASKYANVVPF